MQSGYKRLRRSTRHDGGTGVPVTGDREGDGEGGREVFGMPRSQFVFGLLAAAVHGFQHVFLRLLPPLLPILVVDLDAPLWKLGLLVTVYMFAGGLFQAPMGELSDRVNRRSLLVGAFLAMAIGYVIFVLAPGIGATLPDIEVGGHAFDGRFQMMAVGMLISGVGFSAIHPVGYPLITANVGAAHKGKALGMWGSASKVGDAVAPLLLGGLILVTEWEIILLSVSGVGVLFAGFLWVVFRWDRYETAPAPERADGATSAIDLRGHPRAFLFPIAVVVVSFFFMLFAGNGLMTYAPVFVSEVYAFSFEVGGVTLGPASVANFYFGLLLVSGAISQLFVGGLADRFDHRLVLIVLLGIAAAGLAALAVVPMGPMVLAFGVVLLGASLFGLNPVRDALISDITPAAYEGRTFGYIWTVALVGSSGYPVLIGYLADTMGLRTSFAMLALGALGAMGCVGLLFSRRVYRQEEALTAVPD